MADIGTFPTIHDVFMGGIENTWTFIAGAAIKAGQVVAFSATGVSSTVVASVAETGGRPIGVALYDAASGARVSVALDGAIVTVANADDTTGIDAGGFLETNDNAVKGTVSEVAEAASGGATVTAHWQVCGVALEDIAGGGTGKMLVKVGYACQANSS